MVGTGDGVRVPASGRASRGLPRLLGASMVKEEGTGAGREVGQLGQRGQRPRRLAGRGCRRVVACAAEREVSEGGVRARVGVMARRSVPSARVGGDGAQQGSSNAAAEQQRRAAAQLPCSALECPE